jgi:hypothetical protein
MNRLALTVAALLVSLAVGAAGARAGTYQVLACSQASSGANNSWQPFNSDPTHLSSGQTCPPQPGSGESVKSTGMFATDSLGSSSNAPDGSTAGWRFTAPPGTTIVGLQDDRYLGIYADSGWTPFVKADSTVLETCTFSFPAEGCSVGSSFGSSSLNGLLQVNGASTLTAGVECAASIGCSEGATLHSVWATLYGAKVTLSEQAPPSIASPGGALWGPGPANGFHKGVEQVSFQASDLTGISRANLSVDGSVLSSRQGVCDFTQPLPCQPLSPLVQLDTTQLTDGAHTVALDAYNAAGNEARLTEQIVVANQPPRPPVGLKTVVRPDGSFVVSWGDPPDVAPIVGSTYELCPPSGVGCTSPTPTGHDSPLSLPASAAGQTVKVWLSDAAGNSNPANAASSPLSASASGLGAQPAGSHHLPSLRLRHTLRGHRLTVIALAPRGVTGPIEFSVQALRGRRSVAHGSRRAKLKRGRAEVVFVLSRAALGASRLAIRVSARGASAASVLLVLHHPSHRRALLR